MDGTLLVETLACDVEVAERHAELLAEVRSQGSPRGAHDLLIAATARASDRMVLTGDASGFAGLTGVRVLSHRG